MRRVARIAMVLAAVSVTAASADEPRPCEEFPSAMELRRQLLDDTEEFTRAYATLPTDPGSAAREVAFWQTSAVVASLQALCWKLMAYELLHAQASSKEELEWVETRLRLQDELPRTLANNRKWVEALLHGSREDEVLSVLVPGLERTRETLVCLQTHLPGDL